MRVDLGALGAIPSDRCIAVADGRVVVARVGDDVVAFQNRCLHQNSKLEDGRIDNGKLTCPLHFWRYEAATGRHLGGRGTLESYPVEIVDGRVFVEAPDPEPVLSMREMMLRHAREWSRDD